MNQRVLFLLLICLLICVQMVSASPKPEIFDGHIHYSSDVWDKLSPERAFELIDEAGIARAMVSATPPEGAERLYRVAPERVVPFLRPYKSRADRNTWTEDASLVDYVREQLTRLPYRGIGEFHLFGDQARRPVVTELITLARERKLALHAHTDLSGIKVFLEKAPDIPVLWAHGGFDVPEKTLRELLSKHPQLHIELSFRHGITEEGQLTPVWRELFTDFQNRFLLGMDTYTPQRWVGLPELAAEARSWLKQLPEGIAQDIAIGNADRLFPVRE